MLPYFLPMMFVCCNAQSDDLLYFKLQNYVIFVNYANFLCYFWFLSERCFVLNEYSCTCVLHIYNTKTRKTRTVVSKRSVGLKYANYECFATRWFSNSCKIWLKNGISPPVIQYLLGGETIVFRQQQPCRYGVTVDESHCSSIGMAVEYLINLTSIAHRSHCDC